MSQWYSIVRPRGDGGYLTTKFPVGSPAYDENMNPSHLRFCKNTASKRFKNNEKGDQQDHENQEEICYKMLQSSQITDFL